MFRKTLLSAVAASAMFSAAQAGTIYTSEIVFNNAIANAGLSSVWSEDFGGFATGEAPETLSIGGDRGEILTGDPLDNTSAKVVDGATGNAWAQAAGTSGGPTIRGFGDTALGVQAFSFDFSNQNDGIFDFNFSGGSNSELVDSTNFSDPEFIGWIGDSSELLSNVTFGAGGASTFDNVTAYSTSTVAPIPVPASLLLLGSGLFGLISVGHRQRRQSKA